MAPFSRKQAINSARIANKCGLFRHKAQIDKHIAGNSITGFISSGRFFKPLLQRLIHTFLPAVASGAECAQSHRVVSRQQTATNAQRR